MPRHDIRCPYGHEHEVFVAWDAYHVPCPTCGATTDRLFKASATVAGDECDFYDPNLERRFTSKAEHDRAIKEQGWVRKVKHVGASRGSDKSPLTQRWVAAPTISEAERIAHWHATEAEIATPTAPVALVIPDPVSAFTVEQRESLARTAAQLGL